MPVRSTTLARSPFALAAGVALVVIAVWLAALGPGRAIGVVADEWPVALTMVFGSFIAGASSEGGGAVAFPVFTKVLNIAPADAKLFALMIQSVGMTAASLTILAMRVRIDAAAAVLATIGGAVGVVASLLLIAPMAPPAETRVVFTAMQAGFAFVLIRSLRLPGGRAAVARLGDWRRGRWRGSASLVAAGFFGGVVSGLVGSGVDLALFAVLTLLFGVSEKVATPTSVVVMAANSLVAVAAYATAVGPAPANVVSMWLAAVPIVVVGAPLGAWFCSRLRRTTIGWMLVGLIAIEIATTIYLIPQRASTVATGVGVSLACVGVCILMARRNRYRKLIASRGLPDARPESGSRPAAAT